MKRLRYGGVVAGQEEIDAAVGVLSGEGWASGAKVAEFEAAAAIKQGRAHALFVNSGSSALLLGLSTLPKGTRVAMPATQFPTLWSAALWCGLRPELVDVDDTLNMDPEKLSAACDTGIAACAFVHMAGNPANIAEVAGVCARRGIFLLEDICEALGAQAGDTAAGNFGDIAATSTHAAHQISTGEGGIVYTDDPAAYARMRRVRDWGRAYGTAEIPGYYDGYVFAEQGLNLHATDIQAAIGLVQLGRLDGFVSARRRNWLALAGKTANLPIRVPRVAPGYLPSWYTFPMLVAGPEERAALCAHLDRLGIESRPVVAGNMARQPCDTTDAFRSLPVADEVFRRGLWVSVHPGLDDADMARIADALISFWMR